MAKSTRQPPRRPIAISAATPFDDPATDTNAANGAEAAQEPAQEAKPSPPRLPSFFQTMNKVQKADWGPRATIYLYRVEPVIDRTRSGDNKYIMTYAEPVNEERIMADCGSGRYKLILNFRKPGADQGDTVDTTYMEILNMKYPPKIPIGEWVDDPRNRKWQWAKEASQGPPPPPAPTGVETLVDVMRVTGDLRREMREEMQEQQPAQAVTAVDPWSAAEKILNMRSENPMVAILQQQMKDAAAATEAERQRAFTAAEAAREREFKLQEKLMEARSAPAKSMMDQLLELAAMGDKLEPLKKMFGFNGAGEASGRIAKTTGMDILHDVVTNPQVVQTLYAAAVNLPLLFARGATPTNGPVSTAVLPPAANPAAPSLPETAEQRMQRIGAVATEPMLYQFFLKGESGEVWADRMQELWPNDFAFIQSLGPEAIVNGYRGTRAWMIIAPMEGEFIRFMQEFCAWNANEGPTPPADGETGVVDLDAETGA